MKVAVLSPTTSQLVEKMAALFPDGVDLVGPQADDRHYWNDCHLRLDGWRELGLKVRIVEKPYQALDFSQYDLLIESVETFQYSKDWVRHCLRLECPVLIKACWTDRPERLLPTTYIAKVSQFPVLLEMPAHAEKWKAHFQDVNVIPNPVGDWWFRQEWSGKKERVLFVLSGKDAWRPGDESFTGLDRWEKLCSRFPGKTYHHDGHKDGYKTPRQMTELFSESRVFVNFDRPFGQGERPLTLAFTEALSAGLPVAARDLPGLSYRQYIDSNGVCSDDFEVICSFVETCLADLEFARRCSARSRELALKAFAFDSLLPKYMELIRRAQYVFAEREGRRKRRFAFLGKYLGGLS
jgi:hypothetical protein